MELEKKKVLVLYNNLFHYRVAIFELLAEKFDLTVAYSIGPELKESVSFNIIKLPIMKRKRWVYHKNNIIELCQQFDVVLTYADLAWLKYITIPLRRKRNFKVIFWTIGVSASYEKKYDAISRWNSVRDFFYKKADAIVFYSEYPIRRYLNAGFDQKKLFVAPNTVKVLSQLSQSNLEKDSFLFIGTLYMQKGIAILLENYKLAYLTYSDIFPLNIVGGGPEYKGIESWISQNSLSHKIFLQGPVFDLQEKASFFRRAYACISPIQAGLSVLESMGYGVPFITIYDALTGGERFNIHDGYNGVLLKKADDLKNVLLDVCYNKEKYLRMGQNAIKYYNDNRTPSHMAKGLIDAINFVSAK